MVDPGWLRWRDFNRAFARVVLMLLRIRHTVLGGHVHCRVFTAPAPDETFAKCGDLTFSIAEWPEVVRFFQQAGAQIMEEEQ